MGRLILIFGGLALLPLSAHAYFDPGAGAVLLQLLVAAGIGAAYRLRRFFAELARAIAALFKR
jgi:hypothetical protein